MARRIGGELGVLALYVLLALGLTYPLAARLTSAIPGTSSDLDVTVFIWNIWWTRHALLDLHANPFATRAVLAPNPVDLRLHTYGFLNGLLSIPFQSWLGVVGAFNLLLLFTIAMNGYATFALVRQLGVARPAAVIAGAFAACSPALALQLRVGHLSTGALWPVSLALLFAIRLAERRRPADALKLGLSLVAALLLDFQIVLFAGIWLGLAGGWLAATRRQLLRDPVWWRGVALAAIVAGLPLLAIFFDPLVHAERYGYVTPSAADTLGYSYRFWDFGTPMVLRVILGLALPTLLLLTIASWRSLGAARPWLLGGLAFLVLSLGVALQPTAIPLPFAVLRRLPGGGQFRTPYRLAAPALIGFAVAAAFWLDRWLARVARPAARLALTGLAIGLIVLDGRSAFGLQPAYPLQTYPDLAFYERVAAEPGDFLLLEVPVGVRSGTHVFGRYHAETLQFYQPVHGKRLINGMVARVPVAVFEDYRRSPALALLAGEPVAESADLAADLSAQFDRLDARYVVVHTDLLPPADLSRISALLDGHPQLEPAESLPPLRVYAVRSP